ncbi:lymphoid-specific helicase-like [Microplitis mediator]|uniref:lymphoid-specific helicase-like n=1 Tax=Microplitis mediator TaxID=375433 RepID=UPI002554978B|nr:lymphoid-specific helicase-like [Microplitis mediator]
MDATDTDVLKDLTQNSNIPKVEVGTDEDSGFSSLPSSTKTSEDVNNNLICQDVKFVSIQIDSVQKKIRHQHDAEQRRLENEEYHRQRQEQAYNSLKHLLKKSKFYSTFIKANINNPASKSSSKPGDKRHQVPKLPSSDEENEENSPPKRPKLTRKRLTEVKKKNLLSSDEDSDYTPTTRSKAAKKGGKHIQSPKINLSVEDIEDELNSTSDDEPADEKKFVLPKYFNGSLYPYQEKGFEWLQALNKNGLNGILADEMGLGKTIQVIALLCWLMETKVAGPYLIIAPLSTIPNWTAEFARFAPTLPVYVLHGPLEERKRVAKQLNTKKSVHGFKTYPIILTTYEVTVRDASLLRGFNWRYIVVDEGQRIKNANSQLARMLRTFNSVHRLLLTGTPLQNDLNELWALLNFLQPDIFNDLDVFQSWFDVKEMHDEAGAQKIIKQESEKNVVSMLREILKPFMLRRIKEEVALDLPGKKELIVYAPITELQRDLYTAVLNYDSDVLSMKVPEPETIDLPNGTRPKRACTMRNKFSLNYFDPFELKKTDDDDNAGPSNATSSNNYYKVKEEPSDEKKLTTVQENCLSTWKKYADINDRNRDYFIRTNFGRNRYPLYRKIVNHPYLVHWPKAPDGYLEISENLLKTSGKLLVLDAMLKKLHAEGHKVLIFSTLVMLLDLLEEYLTLRPWNYVTLSGRTPIEEREVNIDSFNNDPDVFIFLVSTRAGGVGLNLAGADTVILYDSDWNPQVDIQAMARCHRIGQTRPVVVYKLCTKGTIDEIIMTRAQAKRNLEKMVISKQLESANTMTGDFIEQMQQLLKTTDSIVVTSENDVYTDAELEAILDRSDLYQGKAQ